MPSQQNIQQVENLTQKLQQSKSSALIQYQGLSADEIASLRASIRAKGGQLEVIKNTLITLALEKLGLKMPDKLTGPTAVTFSNEDEIAPLKEVQTLSKNKEDITFKYGIFENKLLNPQDLNKLLALPSKSALIGQLVGDLINPLQRLVYSLKYNQIRLALVLKAISEKQ